MIQDLQVRVDGSNNGNSNSHVLWWSGFQINRGPLQDFTPDYEIDSSKYATHDDTGYVRYNAIEKELKQRMKD